MKRWLLFVAVSVAVPGMPLVLHGQPGPAVRPLLLNHATLIDVVTGLARPNTAVLITGNFIVAVGKSGDIRVPPDATVIDVTGKWIIPGLIDMHTHGAGDPGFPLWLYVANGVTSIRDTGGPVTALRLTKQNIQSGKKLGPRLFYAGTILDGSPPLFPAASTVVDTPRQAEAAVDFLIEQGADFIKVYNSITEPVLEAIIRTAHRRGIPVTGHVPRTLTMSKVVEMGIDGLEHIRVTGQELGSVLSLVEK